MSVVDQAKNAEACLEDTVHEERLDKLLRLMSMRRDAAARQVPEWEELRTVASDIKEHTLSNLSQYLIEFEAKATANGITVHWARDAHEHNQIVYDLLADRQVPTLVKSKSMLTEECELRPFLETRGIRVTETDLGERIQQLDDQPPGHIVGPSIHKTQKDVANLFAKNYGSDPNNEDPAYLAGVMRENTRP
jgi:L-lactate dehydrogenase complex protein LldF